MVAAQNGNFIEGGVIDPFTGAAPGLTPEEQQRILDMRRMKMRADATRTANTNNAPGGYSGQRAASDQSAISGSNRAVFSERMNRTGSTQGNQRGFLGNLIRDPVTMGVLAAPLAVTGAGAAFGGAAGLGLGEASAAGGGTVAGTSAGMPAGIQAVGAPSTIASPFAAGASSGVPAAAGATATTAAAAAPSALEQLGAGAQGLMGKAAVAAAPFLINEAFGGRTKEEKALIAKQEQLAQEAKVRQGQQQDARMNALGQQMLAFNPTNQMMAQMFGPDAAFQPEQMAQMAQGQPPPSLDPSLVDYRGTDPKKQAQIEEWIRRKKEFDAAEAQRRDMIMGGFKAPGPGPAPMQMPAAQAPRRY